MNWKKYMALLNWQGQTVLIDDFNHLESKYDRVKSLEDLIQFLSHPKTKEYVLNHKFWWKTAEKQIELCSKHSIQLTWPGESCFPKLLNYYKNSPTLLSYKGYPCWSQNNFQLCLVGGRKIHPETSQWMDHFLASFLKKHNVNVLSGGARGVDQKSHGLAIRTGRPTLCFLPSGLLNPYPSSLKEWETPILNSKGAFISPFPPDFQIRRAFFHYRNSIMVRMSNMVFILQAEERSGSMLTAQLGAGFGVTLAVLPGSPMNPLFKGNLKLINEGVFMIRDCKDLDILYQVQKTCLSNEAAPPSLP